MKKISFLFLYISVALFANAQLRKIPAEVTDAFATRYPHATKVEWRDKLQHFEASFVLNGYNISADFGSDGSWQSSDRIIQFDELPDAVKDGFKKSKFADWEQKSINEVQEQTKPIRYKISVQKSGIQKKNLFFNADGKLLKENIAL